MRIPFYLVDSTGTAVTGLTFSGAEIQISKNGAANVNGTGSSAPIGAGAYYYELGSNEGDTPGVLLVKINKAGALPFVATITLPVVGSDLIVGQANAALRRIPVFLVNSSGAAVTGAAPSGAQIQISKNGAAWVNAAGTWTEISGGEYYYTATAGEVDTAGFLAIKVAATGALIDVYSVVVGIDPSAIVVPVLPPVPVLPAGGNRLETLLAVLAAPMQRLENTMIDLLTKRTVDTATGVQLDVIGRIVGQGRNGQADDLYRRYIRARIATNKSTGKREELIRIARLILNDPSAAIYIVKQPPAAVYVRIDNVPETPDITVALVSFLTSAAAIGVRVIVQTRPAIPSLTFKFAGGAVVGPGFDNTASSPGSGGQLSDVRDLA